MSANSEATLGSLDDLRSFQTEYVASALGCSKEQTSSMIDRLCYREVEKRFDRIRPFKNVVQCIESFKDAGLTMGILSDLPPKDKLKRMGLSPYFETAICSEEFGTLKPSPIPFIELVKRLGVLPEEMIYVGNKIEYDAKGAKAIGMKTAILGSKPHPSVDCMFKSWNNLKDWILSLSNSK
jgi:putative hydrolase of the HAD superfamily